MPQPREHAVRCHGCGQDTWNPSGWCDRCGPASGVTPHAFTPDPGYTAACTECGLGRGNRRHAWTTPTTPPARDPHANTVSTGATLTATSTAAEAHALPRSGTVKAAVLDAVAAAGRRGVTDAELARHPALRDVSPNTLRPRRIDLTTAGFITPAYDADNQPLTRPTGMYGDGPQATAWTLTYAGRAAYAGTP